MESNMSVISAINNSSENRLLAATQSASTGTPTSSAPNSTANTSAPGTTQASTQVTLSPAAQILAQLAAAGITFTIADAQGTPVSASSVAGITLPSKSSNETANEYAMQICSALASTGLNVSMTDPGGVSMGVGKIPNSGNLSNESIWQLAQQIDQELNAPPTSNGAYDGNISQPAFDTVIEHMGGTKSEADQIFSSLDTDGNGSISNSELLNAVSLLGSNKANSGVQELEKLLVPYGDSTVTDGELLNFESAMVAAENAAS
jgi:Ca2+-binding EF-hand superfamily protein